MALASAAKFQDFFVHSRISLSNIGGSHASERERDSGIASNAGFERGGETSASRRAAPGGVSRFDHNVDGGKHYPVNGIVDDLFHGKCLPTHDEISGHFLIRGACAPECIEHFRPFDKFGVKFSSAKLSSQSSLN